MQKVHTVTLNFSYKLTSQNDHNSLPRVHWSCEPKITKIFIMLKIACLAACAVLSLAQSPSFGGCPAVPAQSTFDLNRVRAKHLCYCKKKKKKESCHVPKLMLEIKIV